VFWTSATSDVSGFCTETTLTPWSWSFEMTAFQAELFSNAPCTKTTVTGAAACAAPPPTVRLAARHTAANSCVSQGLDMGNSFDRFDEDNELSTASAMLEELARLSA
jgi:hypothetical protein